MAGLDTLIRGAAIGVAVTAAFILWRARRASSRGGESDNLSERLLLFRVMSTIDRRIRRTAARPSTAEVVVNEAHRSCVANTGSRQIIRQAYDSVSSNALASFRSGVSRPSVNQP